VHPLAHERKEENMPESDDTLISPQELRRMHPHFGLRLQREHRVAGDFIPFIKIGNRIFYKRSSVNRFLQEAEQQGGNTDVS
jgi:hypothetical protein